MPKPETVSITIYPSTAESADLTVADAMQQVLDAFELLSKAQLGRTGEPTNKVVWRLEKASTNSPLTIEASASSYDPAINLDVEARQAKIAFFEGVNGLLAAKKKPDWMDKDAETTVRRLFARNLNGIGRTDFVFEEGAAPVIVDHRTAARAVNFLERLAAEEAAKIEDLTHEEYGAVEAQVTGTTTHYRKPAINIRLRLAETEIRCVLSSAAAAKIGPQHNWTEVWTQQRVIIMGKIHYDKNGDISLIEAEDIEVLPHAPISIESIERSSGITSEQVSDFLRRGWVDNG